MNTQNYKYQTIANRSRNFKIQITQKLLEIETCACTHNNKHTILTKIGNSLRKLNHAFNLRKFLKMKQIQ